MSARKMDKRVRRFCEEYIVDLNARQAAIRAGYKPSNAGTYGTRMLARDDVQAEVARLQAQRSERVQISADAVLREIAHVAMEKEPAPHALNAKMKALDMLARHLGLYTKDNEQQGRMGMAQLAAAILGNVAGAGGVTVEGAGAD